MESSTQFLAGLTVLVTRPKELADNLARLIKEAGGTPVLYPVISIEEPENTGQRSKILNSIASFDIAIFISPTAVRKTFEHIKQLPATIKIASIGSSTEKALKKNNATVSIQPDGHNSEALLKHPGLQADKISDKSIVIFRGEGGRELLGETLRSRGSHVDYAEMYQRKRAHNLEPLSIQQIGALDIVAVTSNEGLQNLVELSGNTPALLKLPLLVPGERCEKLAKQLGFATIVRAEDATDLSCIKALHSWVTILDDKAYN